MQDLRDLAPVGPSRSIEMSGVVYQVFNVRNMSHLANYTKKSWFELSVVLRRANMQSDYIQFTHPVGKPELSIFKDVEGNDIVIEPQADLKGWMRLWLSGR